MLSRRLSVTGLSVAVLVETCQDLDHGRAACELDPLPFEVGVEH